MSPSPRILAYARHMGQSRVKALQAARWFVLLVVRGLLLWVLIPVGLTVWLLVGWIVDVRLGAVLGLLDLNLIAALQRVLVLQRSGDESTRYTKFIPMRSLPSVEHRIGLLDPL